MLRSMTPNCKQAAWTNALILCLIVGTAAELPVAADDSYDAVCAVVESFSDVDWLDSIRSWVEHGNEIDATCNDWNDETLLQVAAGTLNGDVVRWLLAHGADVNHQDAMGTTALYIAMESAIEDYMSMQSRRVDFEVAAILLESGADRTLADNDGRVPADLKDDYLDDGVDRAVNRLLRN